jgi:hypothetical protein
LHSRSYYGTAKSVAARSCSLPSGPSTSRADWKDC